MAETKKFKTESKRLLDLMINSIYTNKDIFLRELISNASDAIDKYHYLSLTDEKLEKRNDYKIELKKNKDLRTITITDNGIGMTYDELNKCLGTIASSGSNEFIKKMKENEEGKTSEIDIIGQFGVGFYSAFMVASKVEVETLSPFSDKAYKFTSTGEDSYTIDESIKSTVGTEITLYLREDTEDVKFSEYLEEYKIKSLVKKYSDYVRYPITMYVIKKKYDDNNEELPSEIVEETLNSMIPLWKKPKSEITKEALSEFYKNKFMDYKDPFDSMSIAIEGNLTYNALIFIPEEVPYDVYTRDFEKGLALYTKGVFIMDKCKDLLPDYLRFLKGLVDTADISLNISREMLQQNTVLKKIQSNIEKKVVKELESIKENERERYEKFFKNFGTFIKFGIYESYGERKDLLENLLIFHHSLDDSYISLKEYLDKMPEGQEKIYYASSSLKNSLASIPQLEMLKKKGYDCLVLDEEIDEFTLSMLNSYNDKNFVNISSESTDLLDDNEKEEFKKQEEESKSLLDKIKEALGEKVKDVVISKRLVDSACCLVSGEGLSFEMEKVLKAQSHGSESNFKADRILEINPNHEVFSVLKKLDENNDLDTIKLYSNLLLTQAMLVEGMTLDNPIEFSNTLCDLMIKNSK